jgi:hypothetical protein
VKVLVACEFSGRVRSSFAELGHDATSCDFLPTEIEGPHYQGDIRVILNDGWDLLIAHPPCTHLSVSGARWFKDKKHEQEEALDLVRLLLECGIPRICLENPVSIISTRIRKPDQIIQSYQFGDPEAKKTCLWLKGLPHLVPTNILPKPECGYWSNQTPSGQNKLGPSPTREKERGRTYWGIAKAMAAQWGNL